MEHYSAARKPEPLKVYALSSFRSWLERAYPLVSDGILRDKLRDGSAELVTIEFDDYEWTKVVIPAVHEQLAHVKAALGGHDQVLLLRFF